MEKEKPYVRVEQPKPRPHEDPHVLGQKIVQEHAIATSRAKEPSAHVRAPAPKPAPAPQKPPLEGATSLKDALAQAMAKKETEKQVPAPDLKETLEMVAPQTPKQAHLAPEVLHDMLAVDEADTKGE